MSKQKVFKKQKETEKLYRKNKKLELLNELILEISYKKDKDELLNTFLKKICKLIDADFGFISELRNSEKFTGTKCKYDLPNEFLNDITLINSEERDINCKICNAEKLDVVKNNNVVIYETEDEIFRKLDFLGNKYDIKSLVIIPLNIGEENISGVIHLFSVKDNKIFYKHKSFLKAVGNVLSIMFKEQMKVQEEQDKLLRTEKIKVLGEMAGGIAHDFNNVLTSIVGYTQMSMYSNDIEKTKKYLDVIYKCSLDGKAIVDKIQKFTRKKTNNNKNTVNLNKIVKSSLDMVKPIWKNEFECRNIKIEVENELLSESYIYCNEYEIRECIINILINAIDAMPNGGTLKINTYDEYEFCYITIEDNGIGISEIDKIKIFEPFYTTKKSRGTGLGLSIVINIINEHDGNINLESEMGKGSKFIIKLKKQKNNDEDIKMIKDLPKLPFLNGLIVEDKKEVALSLSGMLNILGINHDIELDSDEVINRIEDNSYDFILCDLSMPKTNGVEVSRLVKNKYDNIKFILITGWPGNLTKDELKNIDYLLEKPCTLEELVTSLKTVLELE